MLNLSWLPPVFAQASERLVSNLSEFAGTATVWLAVTGLSRSGKTVFITSLIHNLLSALQSPGRMPLLEMVGARRLSSNASRPASSAPSTSTSTICRE
ncbi:MAG: YcjX family protein [Alphaproteobacteria bacterium]|nr:MAG: YcjX family protein [Alphaproteobacteria bacterium]